VAAAAAAGAEIRELFVVPDLLRGDIEFVAARSGRVIEVSASAFASVTKHIRSDGVLATVVRPSTALSSLAPPRDALLAVAVGIERPGNLGTIVRTACAAGVDGFVVADPCTDVYHPDVIRGSVGTVFHARPAVTTTVEAIAWLEARAFRVVATTPSGELEHSRGDYRGDVAIVVGSERHGLPEAWLGCADRRVAIPMRGAADSLNVAVASGVVLFEAVVDRDRARSSP